MANQNWQRSQGKGKFNYLGMNITRPGDAMPPGRCPLLLNVQVDSQTGMITQRPGLVALGTPSAGANPVHSLLRFLDPLKNQYIWLFGAGGNLYYQGDGTAPAVIGSGYSGNPLSLVPYRPPSSESPRLYVFDSVKQAKYKSDRTEQAVGIFPPPRAPVTGLALPLVKSIADISSISGWTASGAASNLSVTSRMQAGTTIANILYDTGTAGWCTIHPSGTTFSYIPTMYPAVALNGWSAHLGDFEGGVDQGHAWIIGSAGPYQNPQLAMDASGNSKASYIGQHNHAYAGCVWSFANQASTPITGMTLSILSEIPADGTDGLSVNTRSAGIWYSLDQGVTWTNIYTAGSTGGGGTAFTGRPKQWDTIAIPANQDPTKIQVMAFADAHDDFAHYVYEINLTASSHNAAFSFGGRLTLGGATETVTVHQMFPALTNTTVACIIYDNAAWNGNSGNFGTISGTPLAGLGGSGMATVQMTAPVKLDRNRMVIINGNMSRVLSVSEGPDGLTSFRCSLPAGIVPGNSVVIPTCFRCYPIHTHAAGDSITSNLLNALITPGPLASAVGLVAEPVTLDLSQFGNNPFTDEDYLHVSLRFDHPENVTEVHIMLDVDNQTNDFTGNYYYYVVRQNDFQSFGSADSATTTDLLDALTNEVAGNYTQSQQNTPSPDELPVGESQFYEATFKFSDLTRVGTDPLCTLASVKAIGIRAICTGSCTLQFGSWWAQGTAGPDCNFNAYGNQGQPIIYRYRYRSSVTGAISNPSPATRSGDLPIRTGVQVQVVASPDAQADLIDIERNGGTFDDWHQALTVPNVSGTYTDNIRETVAMAGDPLDTDAYPPWPVTDVPHTLGAVVSIPGCEITGTRVYCFDAAGSGAGANIKWARGSEIIVNNKVYSLYAPPESPSTFQTEENIGILHNVTIRVPEATIMGAPLPYACLHDGRVFAAGDPLNPGILYFGRPYNPDTASDSGWIEVTSPSEPLMAPVEFEGALYVFSSTNLYRVESTGGGVNPYQAYKLGSVASGLVAPWSYAVGPAMAWLGQDGIYLYGGAGGSENITKADLDTLFNQYLNRPDSYVAAYAALPMPVDLTRSSMARNRLSWAGNNLYFDYLSLPSGLGVTTTLVYNRLTQGWVTHAYYPSGTSSAVITGAALHYQEPKYAYEPGGATIDEQNMDRYTVVAGNDGRLYYLLNGVLTDAGNDIPCQVLTPYDDQGDSRARKQYGDLMLDYHLGTTSESSPFYVGVIYDFADSFVNPPFYPAASVSATARTQEVFDLGMDANSLHRNMALVTGWIGAADVKLFEWQPSYFITPDDSLDRPTDWVQLAGGHYVFVHGLRIDADTSGQVVNVQIQYDGGINGPLLLVNHNGEQVKPYTFPPFKCHMARLVPGGPGSWRLFGADWEVDPEPEPVSYWVSQPSTFDMPGYLHIRSIQFAYASVADGGVLSVIVDGTTYTLISNLLNTGGMERKIHVVAPPVKGKLWQLQAIGVNTQLQVYERDCEFRVKPWGTDAYQVLKPLGDTTRTSGGAKI